MDSICACYNDLGRCRTCQTCAVIHLMECSNLLFIVQYRNILGFISCARFKICSISNTINVFVTISGTHVPRLLVTVSVSAVEPTCL